MASYASAQPLLVPLTRSLNWVGGLSRESLPIPLILSCTCPRAWAWVRGVGVGGISRKKNTNRLIFGISNHKRNYMQISISTVSNEGKKKITGSFRPQVSGLAGALLRDCPGGGHRAGVNGHPLGHSGPHSLSPTMPSGTRYSSVIEVLQRETMRVSLKSGSSRGDGRARRPPGKKTLKTRSPASCNMGTKPPQA